MLALSDPTPTSMGMQIGPTAVTRGFRPISRSSCARWVASGVEPLIIKKWVARMKPQSHYADQQRHTQQYQRGDPL
jgi:hypothetical protein